MRFLLIFLTLCVVGIYAKEMDLATDKIMECVKELQIDSRDIGTLDPSKKGCLLACMYKKVNKDGQSLYDSLSEAINKPIYMNSFGVVYDEDGVLRARLLSKLKKCHARAGKDDCKFMTCLNIFESPFLEFLTT